MEGSETGSREGSDVACTEGICNHDENGRFGKNRTQVWYPQSLSIGEENSLSSAGDDPCVHRCDDKEEDGDSCVECWANSEENNTKGKNKKKKKKSKTLKCENEHVRHIAIPERLFKCIRFTVVTTAFQISLVSGAADAVTGIVCSRSVQGLQPRSCPEQAVAGGASALLCS